jgi:four helix bundle protein
MKNVKCKDKEREYMENKGRVDLPERTFAFALRIIDVSKYMDALPGVGRTLARQLLRSGTSIGANVEEGQAGQSKPDFIAKLSISLKEARETRYWLRLISTAFPDLGPRLVPLQDECTQLIAILTTILKNARNKYPRDDS